MSKIATESSEIIWMSNDSKEVITKISGTYHFVDRDGKMYSMGNYLAMLKAMLEQSGRSDVIRELKLKNIVF